LAGTHVGLIGGDIKFLQFREVTRVVADPCENDVLRGPLLLLNLVRLFHHLFLLPDLEARLELLTAGDWDLESKLGRCFSHELGHQLRAVLPCHSAE